MSQADLGIAHLADLQLIAHGGFSVVYAATNTQFDRRVAVKVLNRLTSDADRRRFERECKIMGRLSDHPNVIDVYSAGYTPDERPYIEMALIEDGTLAERVRNRGPMPWPAAARQMVAVAQALAVAHESDILHRDIKPENILLAGDEPRLTDFGIAYLRDSTGSASTQISASWLHSPPETFQNQRDERSDLYSLGSTLYTVIVGTPPFWRPEDDSLSPLMYRLLNEEAPRLQPDLAPAAVADLVASSLAKDPDARPQTALAFAAELERALAQAPQDAGTKMAPGGPADGAGHPTAFAPPSVSDQTQAAYPQANTPAPGAYQPQGFVAHTPPPQQQTPPPHQSGGHPPADYTPPPSQTPPPHPQAPLYQTPPPQQAPVHQVPGHYQAPPQQPEAHGFSGQAGPTNPYGGVATPPGGPYGTVGGAATGGSPPGAAAAGAAAAGAQGGSSGGSRGVLLVVGAVVGLLLLVGAGAIAFAVLGGDSLPERVSGLTVTEADSQLTIDFAAPSAGSEPVVAYEVSVNDGDWETLPDSRQLTGLTNGSAYSLRVRAVGVEGPGEASALSDVAIPYGRPDVPVIDGRVSGQDITWTWAEPDGNGREIIGYLVSYDGDVPTFQPGRSLSPPGNLGPLELHEITVQAVNEGDDDDRNTSEIEVSTLRTGGTARVELVQSVSAFGNNGVEMVLDPQSVEHGLDLTPAWRVSCQQFGPEYVSVYWEIELRLVEHELLLDVTEQLRYDGVNGESLFASDCGNDADAPVIDQTTETLRFPIAGGSYELDSIDLSGAGASSNSSARSLLITVTP